MYSTIAVCAERTKEEWIYGKLERKRGAATMKRLKNLLVAVKNDEGKISV